MSTGGSVLRAGGKPRTAEAAKRLLQTFPAIKAVNWSESWTAWVGVSADQLPRIYRLDEGMWAALGYSGRGIVFATLMGAELGKLVADPTRDDLLLPAEKMRPIRCHRLAPLGASMLVAWYRFFDSL